MPWPTIKECLRKKTFLAKIDALFFYHTSELLLLITVITLLSNAVYYNLVIKDTIVYPNQEYEYLETVARNNSNDIYNFIKNLEKTTDLEYEINITKDIIQIKYTTPVSIKSNFIESISVTVNQKASTHEIVSINRDFSEKVFNFLMFIEYVFSFTFLIVIGICFIFFLLGAYGIFIKSLKRELK